jgi:cytidylate kinase
MHDSIGEGLAAHAPMAAEGGSPLHGFQGNRGEGRPAAVVPAALTIAVAREAGARGGTIGRRVARQLNWQVYDQDLLEYMTQDVVVRQGLFDNLSAAANAWVESRLQALERGRNLAHDASIVNLARVVLALGSQGEVVLIGRGAGFILPRESTLHVRMMAPLQERIAYMSQWLRLPLREAAEKVQTRDARRAEFVNTHFHQQPGDIHHYDMLLNASSLGEELCAHLIVEAARARSAQLRPEVRGDSG